MTSTNARWVAVAAGRVSIRRSVSRYRVLVLEAHLERFVETALNELGQNGLTSPAARQLGKDQEALQALAAHLNGLVQGQPVVVDETSLSVGGKPTRRPATDYVPKEAVCKQLLSNATDLLRADSAQQRAAKEAYYWRCWAVLFTGLSNSNHFGDHLDSPEPLRYLALAFLNKANQSDPVGNPGKGRSTRRPS
jgi:hypothetical protein